MRWTLFVLVSGLSLSAWILLGTHYFTEAIVLDVVATCIAGVTLGTALSYSFYRHGNLFMVGVTLLTFAIFIQRQFYYSLYGRPQAGPYLWYLLVTFEFLILIFVAHALVWAFSDASRLKPLAGSPRVQVVALLFDLRGSTEWSYEVADTDSNYVKAFQDELREWSTNKVFAQPQGWPNLIKFMGDGFLFVWEIPDSSLVIYFSAIVDAAYNLCVDYRSWVKDTEFMKRFPMGVPIGIGYGVDVGQGTRITFENGSNDYLGAPVNNAAKMQDLARPHGGGVIRAKAWSLLSESLQDKFPKEGPMKIGTRTVAVRMTEEVEYKNHVPKN
jgi:class 3 adenylate cyclase